MVPQGALNLAKHGIQVTNKVWLGMFSYEDNGQPKVLQAGAYNVRKLQVSNGTSEWRILSHGHNKQDVNHTDIALITGHYALKPWYGEELIQFINHH